MEIGMLWYNDGPLPLKDRVIQAASYYTEKYGREPNLCFVHPGMLDSEEGNANGIVIRKDKGIMPGHFWIGVDESQIKKNGNGKKPKRVKSESKQKAEANSKAAKTSTAASAKKSKAATAKVASAKPKAKAKSASAKPKAKAKSASAKPKTKAKSAPAKPRKRKQALLKKKTGSRVKTTSKPKAKAKA
jgi:hypothetical protein